MSGLQFLLERARFGEKPGLQRIGRLLEGLGHPEEAYATLHVAGTNGKGSTAALLAAALRACGYRTGLYTSPHLVSPGERFQVDGQPLALPELDRLAREIRRVVERVGESPAGEPTQFEVLTALAFHFFREVGVEVAVIEAGMGGRDDATNVVRPEVAVITPVGRDHERVLGPGLAEIARNKAGIIKAGGRVVVGPQPAEAREAIEAAARAQGATLRHVGPAGEAAGGSELHLRLTRVEAGREGTVFHVAGAARPYGRLYVPLLGEHQAVNGVMALAALDWLAHEGGWRLPADRIAQGFGQVVWPGRLERLRLREGTELLLDGAHNLEATAALVRALDTLFGGERLHLVFGALAEKPWEAMLALLLPRIRGRCFFTRPERPRAPAADPASLAEAARRLGAEDPASVPEAAASLALARAAASPGEGILVCGSLYLVGEVRARLMAEDSILSAPYSPGGERG